MTTKCNDKRERGTNYSSDDCRKLVSIVKKYAHIIENKKTDGATWKEKDIAWKNVASEFNAQSLSARQASQLKKKYESMKSLTRGKIAAEKQYTYQTGGGPFKPPTFKDNDILEDLLTLIPLSAKGLEARHDSDAATTQEINDTANNTFDDNVQSENDGYDPDDEGLLNISDLEVIDVSDLTYIQPWDGTYTPSMLKRPKHSSLINKSATGISADVHTITSGEKNTSCTGTGLASRRRPSLPARTTSVSSSTKSFATMADAKTELAHLRREFLQKEFDDQLSKSNELHALAVQAKKAEIQHSEELFNVQLETQKVKLALLKLELENKKRSNN